MKTLGKNEILEASHEISIAGRRVCGKVEESRVCGAVSFKDGGKAADPGQQQEVERNV
jgi:hypothetical protein